ncbi:hypothetical protein EXE59_09880 [Nocardioides eburneiflavus]|uniref:Uncharacterized protein n=1 Tax=Nocardioides eburneiflavus TaxID=2518372 RepID=A0A4Z1CFC5_9ACTN|nr:hypothetical protein [Nocardioides eburneiflavus]TGN64228.1 hypothetical protein EXE59_09880 [Nocardioides eburneiflavus]
MSDIRTDDNNPAVRRSRRQRIGHIEDHPDQTVVVYTMDGDVWLLDWGNQHAIHWPRRDADGRRYRLVTTEVLVVSDDLTLLVENERGDDVEIHAGTICSIFVETWRAGSRK